MFKSWLGNYNHLAASTRWLSIVGTLVLIFFAGLQVFGSVSLVNALGLNVTSAALWIVQTEPQPLLILGLLTVRLVGLTARSGTRSYAGSAAWLLIAIISSLMMVEIWFEQTGDLAAECYPETLECFNDRQPPAFPLVSFAYAVLGTIRFAVAGSIAVVRGKAEIR